MRPALVEVYTDPSGTSFGDIYEIKPGPIRLWREPATTIATSIVGWANQLASYQQLLSNVPAVTWRYGDMLWSPIKTWNFYNKHGEQLVTFSPYSVWPGQQLDGLILYDFVPLPTANNLKAHARNATTAIAAVTIAIGAARVAPVAGALVAELLTRLGVAILIAVYGGRTA